MMIERFDLCTDDFTALDWESMQALIELSALWHARARLRSRWLMRAALDALPVFYIDQIAEHYASIERHAPPPVAPTIRISKGQ